MKTLDLNDIFIGLARNNFCLRVQPTIAGQDTNFEELSCEVVDEWGFTLLCFDYHLDHYQHGGNICPYNDELNPHGWYEKIYTIEELIKYIKNK